jgi:hypothetical protein
MILNRRRFVGGLVAGGVCLTAPPVLSKARAAEMSPFLDRARAVLAAHGSRIRFHDFVGLVDFGAPSGIPRFRILDMGNGRVLANHLVAHGRGSDPENTGFLQKFSNRPGSNASSEGSFLTGETYFGKHGRSRQLHGLDPQNDMAFARAIVVHGADYVSQDMARSSGRIGRSLGCFAVSGKNIDEVMAMLGPGRLLFATR